jgi:hypothetical protein
MTTVSEIAKLLHELDPDVSPSTEDWEKLVKSLFLVLRSRRGQHEARRIFTKFAKPVTPAEARIEATSGLLWRYITMKPNRNMALLARQLEAEEAGKKSGRDREAIIQAIWRATNAKEDFGKKVRDYLRAELFERGITARIEHNGKWADVLAGDFFEGFALEDAFDELDNLTERDIFD